MPKSYEKYLAQAPAAGAAKSYEKYIQAPVERRSVEVGPDVYTGNEEQIKAFEASGKVDPEKAGLSIEGRKHTWRDTAKDVSQAPARIAVPILGSTLGSVVPGAGTVAGGAAAGAGLETLLNKAGVGEEGESTGEAALRGAKEGAITGLIPGFGKAGQVVGKTVGSIAGKTAGRVAGLAGEAVGAALPIPLSEGRLPTKGELLLSGGLTTAARGIGRMLPKSKGLLPAVEPEADTLSGKAAKLGRNMQKPEEFRQKDILFRKAQTGRQAADSAALEANQNSEARLAQLVPSEAETAALEATEREAGRAADVERTSLYQPLDKQLKMAKAAKGELDEDVRTAAAGKSQAAYDLEAAKQANRSKLQEEADQAEESLGKAISNGRKLRAQSQEGRVVKGMTITGTASERPSWSQHVPFEVMRPDFISAEGMKKFPKLAALSRQHFGPSFITELEYLDNGKTAKAFGTQSMKGRSDVLNRWAANTPPAEVEQTMKAWSQDTADLMLGDPALQKYISPEARDAALRVASGTADAKTTAKFFEGFQTTLKGHMESPELRAAHRGMDTAKLSHLEATAAQKTSAEAAELAALQQAKKDADALYAESPTKANYERQKGLLEDLRVRRDKGLAAHGTTPEYAAAEKARTEQATKKLAQSKAMSARSAVYGDQPHKTVIRTLGESLGNRYLGATAGAEIGQHLAGTPGRIAGRLVGYAAGSAGGQTAKVLSKAGKALEDLATAPSGVRSKLRVAEKYARMGNHQAAQAALFSVAKRNPEVKEWMDNAVQE